MWDPCKEAGVEEVLSVPTCREFPEYTRLSGSKDEKWDIKASNDVWGTCQHCKDAMHGTAMHGVLANFMLLYFTLGLLQINIVFNTVHVKTLPSNIGILG